MSGRKAPLIALALVLAASIWVRLFNLGDADLWVDEYFHYFTAQSLARGDGPVLPSGETYARGLRTSRLVAAAQAHFNDPEFAARLPSAMFGIGNVLIFTAIAWRVGGPWVAVVAALLLGTYPGALREARNTRFYTEQLNLGLVALWFAWLSIRATPRHLWRVGGRLSVQWVYILATVAAFVSAGQIQPTTYSVALGFVVTLVFVAALDVHAAGREALRGSATVQAVLAGAAAAALVLLLRPSLPLGMVRTALYVPPWAQGSYSPLGYYWTLSSSMPLLIALSPAVFTLVAVQRPRLGALLCSWFAVPLALHSFVFRFQNERYVLLAIPALLLASAIAVVTVARTAEAAMRDALGKRGLHPDAARRATVAAISVAALMLIVSSPAVTFARKIAVGATSDTHTDWRAAGVALQSVPGSDTLPWGSRDALASLFHWKRVDFTIYPGALQRERNGQVEDYYSGVPVLTTPEAIRAYLSARRKRAALIVVDSAYMIDSRSELVPELRRSARDMCDASCGPMHVYLWTWAGEEPAPPR